MEAACPRWTVVAVVLDVPKVVDVLLFELSDQTVLVR